MENYYEILEVSPNASKEIIDKAYKTLAKRYHPDANSVEKKQWAEERFKKINEAYEIISNKEKREEYDRELERQRNQQLIQSEDLKRSYEKLYEEMKRTAPPIDKIADDIPGFCSPNRKKKQIID